MGVTQTLYSMVKLFENVDFDYDSQKLAIGTLESKIMLYDLRTAA